MKNDILFISLASSCIIKSFIFKAKKEEIQQIPQEKRMEKLKKKIQWFSLSRRVKKLKFIWNEIFSFFYFVHSILQPKAIHVNEIVETFTKRCMQSRKNYPEIIFFVIYDHIKSHVKCKTPSEGNFISIFSVSVLYLYRMLWNVCLNRNGWISFSLRTFATMDISK